MALVIHTSTQSNVSTTAIYWRHSASCSSSTFH